MDRRRRLGEPWTKIWKMIGGVKENTTLHLLYGQKKAAGRAVDKAKRDMEEELYRQSDEVCGKNLIYKMAQKRDEDSKGLKTGSVIKDKNGKLVTDRKDVLQVWEDYFQE